MPIPFNIGDVVKTKKQHPCGGDEWEVMRTGMDFRIKCLTCGHQAWISRRKFEKSIKKIIKKIETEKESD